MEQSLYGVAAELLRITSVEALRGEARRNRHWASIYAGFRPNSLTRALLLRGATAFAANPAELLRLCNVFLDSIGVAEGKDPAARFAEAGKLSSLDEQAKALCSLLATTDIRSLPRMGDSLGGLAAQPTQEEQPGDAGPPGSDAGRRRAIPSGETPA